MNRRCQAMVWMLRLALAVLVASGVVPLVLRLMHDGPGFGKGSTAPAATMSTGRERELTLKAAAHLLGQAEAPDQVQVWWGGAAELRDEWIRMRQLRWFTWPDMPLVRERALVAEDGWVLGVGVWHDPLVNELRRAAPGVEWEFVAGHRAHPGDMTFDVFDSQQAEAAEALRRAPGAWPVVLLRRAGADAQATHGLAERESETGTRSGPHGPEVEELVLDPQPGTWSRWRWLAAAMVMPVPAWWLLHGTVARSTMGWIERAVAGWLLGAVAVGWLWWLAGSTGWRLWAGVGMLAILVAAMKPGLRPRESWSWRRRLSAAGGSRSVGGAWWGVAAGTVVAVAGMFVALGAISGPADNVAALGNWLWKARAVAEWQQWPWELLAKDWEGLHMAGYPPGYPLVIAWGQWWSGEVERWLPRGWGLIGWAVATLALLAALKSALAGSGAAAKGAMRPVMGAELAATGPWLLAGAALAAGGPWLAMAGGVQADGWVAAAVLLGWLWCGRWVIGGSGGWLLAGCAMAGLVGGWFKLEGTAFAMIGWVACAVARPGALRHLTWWLGGGLIAVGAWAWQAVVRGHGISSVATARHEAAHVGEWWERLQTAWEPVSGIWLWSGWGAWVRGDAYGLWGVLPLAAILLAAAVARSAWRGCSGAGLTMFWAAGSAGAAAAALAGVVTAPVPMHDLAWLAGVTLDRAGWLPVAAALVACCCGAATLVQAMDRRRAQLGPQVLKNIKAC